jgi:hypothetical protein
VHEGFPAGFVLVERGEMGAPRFFDCPPHAVHDHLIDEGRHALQIDQFVIVNA